MDRTPSPPRRVRTPPAPLHGPRYDNYEPFSPRRSSRVAKQYTGLSRPDQTLSPPRMRTARDVTPTSSRQKPSNRSAHLTLSPPSSPTSPAKHRSPRSTRRVHHEAGALDSDSDHFAPTPARRLLSTMAPSGMLPTPAKTPRKRAFHEDSLRSTARVLFANRPATVADAMPAPSSARKSIKRSLFDDDLESSSGKIGVYVDSKERIPDREDEENNPFITRRGKGKAKAVPKKTRKIDEQTAKIFERAARDEGIVFTHRGKTIFRQYEDVPSTDNDATRSSEDETYRRATANGSRRITRSSVKPKLLFKEEINRLKRERGEEDDEEAPTDIEIPMDTPSRKTRYRLEVTTPAVEETTPPPPPPKTVKRQMSFESWSRVKSSARASSSARAGTKRSGAPLEGPADKRARSEHTSPATSFGSDAA